MFYSWKELNGNTKTYFSLDFYVLSNCFSGLILSTLLAESLRSFLDKLGKRKAFLFPNLSRKDRSDSASRVNSVIVLRKWGQTDYVYVNVEGSKTDIDSLNDSLPLNSYGEWEKIPNYTWHLGSSSLHIMVGSLGRNFSLLKCTSVYPIIFPLLNLSKAYKPRRRISSLSSFSE